MKILVDIKDEKAPLILEVLKHFKYIKIKELIPCKTEAKDKETKPRDVALKIKK